MSGEPESVQHTSTSPKWAMSLRGSDGLVPRRAGIRESRVDTSWTGFILGPGSESNKTVGMLKRRNVAWNSIMHSTEEPKSASQYIYRIPGSICLHLQHRQVGPETTFSGDQTSQDMCLKSVCATFRSRRGALSYISRCTAVMPMITLKDYLTSHVAP